MKKIFNDMCSLMWEGIIGGNHLVITVCDNIEWTLERDPLEGEG